MYHTDVASPARITAETILTHFSLLLYGDAPPPSLASVFQAFDEWWFVPREKKTIHTSLVRARKAYLSYTANGVMPDYALQAYAWSCAHRFGKAVTAEDIVKSIQ